MNEIKTIRCKNFNRFCVKNSFYITLSDHIPFLLYTVIITRKRFLCKEMLSIFLNYLIFLCIPPSFRLPLRLQFLRLHRRRLSSASIRNYPNTFMTVKLFGNDRTQMKAASQEPTIRLELRLNDDSLLYLHPFII